MLIIGTKEGNQSLEKTANYELNEGDHKNIVVFNSVTDVVCTIPKGLRIGFQCTIVQKGTGKVSFSAPAAGSDVNGGNNTIQTKGTWAWAKVLCIDENNYTVDFGGGSGGTGGGGPVLPAANEGTRLVTGSATWAGTGLFFDVTPCTYFINGVSYSSPAAQVQLAAADVTNSRIDVIYVNAAGVAGVLTGTPGASPVKPTVNPATQVEVTFILIAANATTPAGITNETIYAENTEWQHNTAANFDFAYATLPQSGTKCIRRAGLDGSQCIIFSKGAQLNTNNYSHVRMYVKRSNIAPLSGTSISIYFSKNGVTINSGFDLTAANGFNALAYDVWQLVTIPLAALTFSSQNFDSVFIKCDTTADDFLFFDNLVLQGTGGSWNNILISQLGNPFLLSIFEDTDGNGILQTTKL